MRLEPRYGRGCPKPKMKEKEDLDSKVVSKFEGNSMFERFAAAEDGALRCLGNTPLPRCYDLLCKECLFSGGFCRR